MPTRFAESDADAAERFRQYKSVDPFPNIPPGLLSSADISDYVAATGMVCPFDSSSERLKPASYEVTFMGKVVHYTEDGHKSTKVVGRDDSFTLQSNSIAFVQCQPKFRLPDYIAVRFNLRITHVYRGLLLGTGPLVDPGFEGDLFIPLHNLTANPYRFCGGEGLIWMEFTKLHVPSIASQEPNGSPLERQGKFIPFPDDKKHKSIDYYLDKADAQRPIQSSIPVVIKKSQDAVEQAESKLQFASYLGTGVGVAVIISLVALQWSFNSYTADSYKEAAGRYQHLLEETSAQRELLEEVSRDVERLKDAQEGD